MLLRATRFGALVVVMVGLGCSSDRAPGDRGQARTESPALAALRAVQAIPRFAQALAAARVADGDGLVVAPEGAHTRTLGARLPAGGDRAFRVFDSSDPDGFWVDVRPLAVNGAVAVRHESRATIAHDVALDTDAMHFVTATVAEELRVLRSPAASPTARYTVSIGPRVASARLRDGRIELADGTGFVRLSTLPVIAVDAKGVQRDLSVSFRENGNQTFTLETSLDVQGLAHPIVVDPAWTSAAAMKFPHQRHALFTLSDGRALAATNGGAYASTSAEAFTPSTNTWTAIASTPQPFNTGCAGVGFTAGTRAGWGLVAGDGFSTDAGAMYNPTANTWTATPVPAPALYNISLVLLNDGIRALAVPGSTNAPLLFNSQGGSSAAPGAWSSAGTMSSVRNGHAAARLSDGRVLVTGGANATPTVLSSSEIYNPATNTWGAAAAMPAARSGHTATLVGTKVLVAGGNGTTGATSTAWLYDPATNTWAIVGSLSVARADHMAALTATGKVLVVGGSSVKPGTAELFDPATNAFRATGALSEPHTGGRAITISTGVLVTGGDNPSSSTPSRVAELFAPTVLGGSCAIGADCDSSFCVNGVCCGTASCGAGQRCDIAPKKGTCSFPQGAACTTATQCATGLCVDGVCCDTACGAQCAACNVPGKQGTCSPVIGAPVGGRTACAGTTSTNPCAKQYCDGSDVAKCYFAPAGTVECGANACSAGNETHLSKCNGAGACGDTAKSCSPYVCDATRCKSSCAANADCVTGRYCDTTRGECVPFEGLGRKCSDVVPCGASLFCTNGFCCGSAKCEDGASCGVPGKEGTCTRVNGSACKADGECGSGHCVDGVCCDRACDGQCEACDVFDPTTGLAGKCIPVKGVPHGKRTACETGTDVCGAKQCDGAAVDACKSLVGSDVVCRTQSCAGGTQTLEAKCDGAGSCPAAVAKPCGGFACTLDGLACEATCTSNDQCATGYRCQGGACIEPTDRCSEDRTRSIAKDGTETPCVPYGCRTDGRCGTTCTITTDCSPGRICSGGACVSTESPAVGDGGGCSMGARSQRSGPAFLLFAFALGALLHRRRALSVASLAVLSSVGCSTKSPEPEKASVAPLKDAQAIVDEVRHFGNLGGGLDTTHAIVRSGDGFAPLDETSALRASLPTTSNGITRLVSARDARVWAEIRSTDLPASPGVIAKGAVVYAGDAQDVVLMPAPGRLEEVRIVRRSAPSHVARYTLRVSPSVATVRLREGHVEIVDATGYVHLSTEPMLAFDAKGAHRKVTAALAKNGDVWQLETRLDAAGLVYPIAIDPAWTAVASMNATRSNPTLIALPDNRVMAIAGDDAGLETNDNELYDPVTNVWTSRAPLATARKWQTGAYISAGAHAGRIVLIGGFNGGDNTIDTSTIVYNPATNTWAAGPTLKAARTYASAIPVAGGAKVFVTNGANGELLDTAAGTSTLTTNTMSVSRSQPDVVMLSTGRVMVLGGNTATALTHYYDPATNAFSVAPSMPSARGSIASAVAGNLVLVAGGTDGVTSLASAVVFNTTTSTWSSTGAMAEARTGGLAAALLSGRILVAGTATANTEIWDPVTGTWASAGFLSRSRPGYSMVRQADGSVLIAGGSAPPRALANVDRYVPTALGNACTLGADCLSGYCTNGVCCTTGTCASGATCNRPKSLGTCSKGLGAACTVATECESGSCVDGVCCNTSCTGQCQACNLPGKAGTCFAVSGAPVGGRTACAVGGADPCAAQTCDGFDGTKCHYATAGVTACGTAACKGGVATTAGTCNGAGACNNTSKSCGAYACTGTKCATTCAASGDCASGFYCDTKTSTCVANEGLGQKCSADVPCKTGLSCTDGYCCGVASCGAGSTCGWFGREGTCTTINGTACKADAECGSGHCVDGVCCDTACNGQCEACDLVEAATGRAGRCLPVVGAPHGKRTACDSDPTNACSGSQCGGEARDKCTMFVGSSTPCRKQSCSGGVLTLPAQCDGKGACPAMVTANCDAYTCSDDGARCRTTCEKEGDCATGFYCLVDKCVKRAADCSQDKSTSTPNGGTPVACAPYLCVDSGACGTSCHTSQECAGGFVCDPSGTCVAPPTAEDDGGCAYGHGAHTSSGLLALALALGAARRRRASSASRSR